MTELVEAVELAWIQDLSSHKRRMVHSTLGEQQVAMTLAVSDSPPQFEIASPDEAQTQEMDVGPEALGRKDPRAIRAFMDCPYCSTRTYQSTYTSFPGGLSVTGYCSCCGTSGMSVIGEK
jgi:hypothetical protein